MNSTTLELMTAMRYVMSMSKALHHPNRDQIEMAAVLDALSDPVRLQIVARLAAEGESRCSGFTDYAQKTNLSYHFARLREAGVTRTRSEGPFRYITLRTEDLEARFPGLLPAILANARGVAPPSPSLGGRAES